MDAGTPSKTARHRRPPLPAPRLISLGRPLRLPDPDAQEADAKLQLDWGTLSACGVQAEIRYAIWGRRRVLISWDGHS